MVDILLSTCEFYSMSQLNMQNHDEPASALQAFPDFQLDNPSAVDANVAKWMGIPDWLANPTTISPDTTLPLNDPVIRLSRRTVARCAYLGIEECFAVQTAVIPLLLRSRSLCDSHRAPGDVCVSAPTGSGKTLAYVLPIIDILSTRTVTRLRALIILPTRDLVSQVKETFDAFAKGTDLRVGVVTGQASFAHEQSVLVGQVGHELSGGHSKVDILIATPGRLIDHLTSTPNFTLQHLRFLVIDEADRLLNQSFQDWLTRILQALQPEKCAKEDQRDIVTIRLDSDGVPIHDAVAPAIMSSKFHIPVSDLSESKVPAVQKLLFSATLTRNPAKIASLHLIDPQYIAVQAVSGDIEVKYTTPPGLTEHMIVCDSSTKPLIVLHLLHHLQVTAGLCFTKSVESAHRLFKLIELFEGFYRDSVNEEKCEDVEMVDAGPHILTAAEYSSDLSQAERNNILKQFRKGEIRLLICSDLIARGIDLDRVEVVISYDVPLYMKKYIHRVGRTARAGRPGTAYTIVESQEARHFKEMLKKANHFDHVKKLSIKSAALEPLIPAYQESLQALKSLMTETKSSVAKYQNSGR